MLVSNHHHSELSFVWIWVGQRKIQVSCGGKSEVLKSDTMEPHEAETFVNKRTLYAPIEPYSSGNLKVSDVHTLYWEQSGKPDGHVCKTIIVIESTIMCSSF